MDLPTAPKLSVPHHEPMSASGTTQDSYIDVNKDVCPTALLFSALKSLNLAGRAMIWSLVIVLESSGIQHSLQDWAACVDVTAALPAKQGHRVGKGLTLFNPT